MSTSTGEVRDYIGPFQYLNNAPFEVTHEEGRVSPGSPNGYEYFLRDHLGNVRAVVASAGGVLVSQLVDYDPWGLELSGLGSGLSNNRAKFNGKETLAELGGGLLDFGARGYDATIGRMHQVDAASELFQAVSGYTYGLNNPIFNIDPTGDTTVPYQEIGPAQWHNFDTKTNDIGLSEVSVKTQGSSGGGGGGSSGGSLVNEAGQRINRDGTPYYDPTDMFSTQLMVIPQTEGNEWAERIDNVLAIFSPIKALQGLFVFSKINPAGKVIAVQQIAASSISKIINVGKQGKHIIGHNNYMPGKSILTENAQNLLDAFHAGKIKFSQVINNDKTRVDFGKIIGTYINPQTSQAISTSKGIIVNSKTGVHIIPSAP